MRCWWQSIVVGWAACCWGLAAAQSSPRLFEVIDIAIDQEEGLIFTTRDGSSFVRLTGRFHFDFDFYDGAYNAQGTGLSSDNEIRRARLGVEGRYEGPWHYAFILNVDDQEQTSTIDTALVQYRVPDRDVAISAGRFKRPFGLEPLISSNWLTTIERAVIFDLIPANNTAEAGLMVSGGVGPARYFLGAFDAGVEDISTGRDEYALHARLAGAWVGDGGLVHLGLAYADQQAEPRTMTSVSSRFGVHTLPFDQFQFVDEITPERERTALLSSRDDRQWGLELAGQWGPLTAQFEWLQRDVDLDFGDPVQVRGGYLQLAWTLTGEARRYEVAGAVFGRLVPTHPRGAWELVAKVEQVAVRQGDQRPDADLYTLGLNWQPNDRFRFLLNYLRHESDQLAAGNAFDNRGSAVTSRLQFLF